jgi:putative transposase
MRLTHVDRDRDGRAHMAGVTDCRDRGLLDWELARRGQAGETEQAIETADRTYRLTEEYITPYTPELHGIIGIS